MKLHTVFISYNRGELLERAIASYLETVTVPFTLAVVDNGSTDGTQKWLKEWWLRHPEQRVILLSENKYPGYACNRGWELAPADADFLHRADNDWEFLPRWCQHVAEMFQQRKVGQVGLRTNIEESARNRKGLMRPVPWNVGGNMVIRRALWDRGLRYDERPWPELPTGMSEDSYLSPAVEAMGYRWMRVRHPCIADIGIHQVSAQAMRDPYYRKSWGDRGIGLVRRPEPRRRRRA